MKTIAKTFEGNDGLGTYFDMLFCSPKSLQEDVINVVEHFINGNSPEIDPDLGAGLGLSVIAYIDGVYFNNPNTGETKQFIPLDHFKIIAEAWLEFLQTIPLNGTRVK